MSDERERDLKRKCVGQEKAQKKFIEISHAYEVLSDPEKKAKYDRHGEAGLNEGGGGGGGGGFQGRRDWTP